MDLGDIGSINFCEKSTWEGGDAFIEYLFAAVPLMGWTRRAPPQPAASGGVLSSPGLFGVPRPAKYAGLPPLDHPARGHSPDEIRRLAARAASPRCRSSSGNSLCGQNSAGFRESARPFKGIICYDISEVESYHPSHPGQSRPEASFPCGSP